MRKTYAIDIDDKSAELLREMATLSCTPDDIARYGELRQRVLDRGIFGSLAGAITDGEIAPDGSEPSATSQ